MCQASSCMRRALASYLCFGGDRQKALVTLAKRYLIFPKATKLRRIKARYCEATSFPCRDWAHAEAPVIRAVVVHALTLTNEDIACQERDDVVLEELRQRPVGELRRWP